MYVCMYVLVMCVHVWVCAYACVCLCVCVLMCPCVCMVLCACACMCVSVLTHMYVLFSHLEGDRHDDPSVQGDSGGTGSEEEVPL